MSLFCTKIYNATLVCAVSSSWAPAPQLYVQLNIHRHVFISKFTLKYIFAFVPCGIFLDSSSFIYCITISKSYTTMITLSCCVYSVHVAFERPTYFALHASVYNSLRSYCLKTMFFVHFFQQTKTSHNGKAIIYSIKLHFDQANDS
jgi:hypothetical protein